MLYDWHTENTIFIAETYNIGIFNIVRIGNIFLLALTIYFIRLALKMYFIPLALTVWLYIILDTWHRKYIFGLNTEYILYNSH
jgi:hypothetical protein